jgi:mandelate racemase
MAAWDALARATDVPLAELLGGSVGPVPAYNSNGLWLKPPAEVAEEAMVLRDEGGFSALKLRLGREHLSDDLATIEAVRRVVGEDIDLMIDFNQGLHIGEALTRCHAVDDLNLAWIEEPIVYDDFGGYAKLAADLKTPLQIGENFYGPRDLYKALQMQACDYVMPDFMRIGGITGWLQAAGVCSAANVPMSTHLYPEVAAHVLRATEMAHWLEWQDWANSVLQEPYVGPRRETTHSKPTGFRPGLERGHRNGAYYCIATRRAGFGDSRRQMRRGGGALSPTLGYCRTREC